jgi:hypothetical protein
MKNKKKIKKNKEKTNEMDPFDVFIFYSFLNKLFNY